MPIETMVKENRLYSDQELLELYQTGDRKAFETIYQRYLPQLYSMAYSRLKNREETEDVVQEVFFRLWHRRQQLKILHLESYLRTAVRNKVYDFETQHSKANQLYAPVERQELHEASPEDHLLAKELMQQIYAYAQNLPGKRQRVFLLYVQQRMSTREIAKQLGRSQKTVQNQLGVAMKGLQLFL